MNLYTLPRYDERVSRLALGVEPRDALTGLRLPDGVDVRRELYPPPVDRWRSWRPGETLTPFLPRMPRHHTGRFALRYDDLVPQENDLRIVDGAGRRFVPRRLRVTIEDEESVVTAESGAAVPLPQWRRAFPVWCFPGSTAPLPSGLTVLRGSIVRRDAAGDLQPVRWARVRARRSDAPDAGWDEPEDDGDVGWAHGDDRGEFVLVVRSSPGAVVVPADPVRIAVRIGAAPTPVPDPNDPQLPAVDPLWDLPLETVTLGPVPEAQRSLTGRRFLPSQSVEIPLEPLPPIALRHGRVTSIVIHISS